MAHQVLLLKDSTSRADLAPVQASPAGDLLMRREGIRTAWVLLTQRQR